MVNGGDILSFLCPDAEWVVYGVDYDSINWFGKEPAITKAQFEAGFAQYDAWKTKQDAETKAKKEALLNKLGITADEAALLLG